MSSDVSKDSVLSDPETATQEECDVPVFSEDEHARFRRRFEEGFDLHTDDRYNLWLSVYSPQDESARENSHDLSFEPSMSNLLLAPNAMKLNKFLPPTPLPVLESPWIRCIQDQHEF